MKNYWHNNLLNKNTKNSISLLIILALVFNVLFPALTLANTDIETIDAQEASEESVSEISTGDAISGLEQESEINTNTVVTETEISPELNTEEISTDNNTLETSEIPENIPDETKPPIAIIENLNIATSSNNADINAETGSNTTESGDFITETGDAVAYVDLVNVVNTNIVNSTGLVDFINDVLGYKDFDMRTTFNDVFNSPNTAESTPSCNENACDPASLFIDLVNEANTTNDITITADTGNNSSYNGEGVIKTGDAYASANIVNLVNTNFVNSNYLLLVFNNFADMSGSLVLPNSDFFKSNFLSEKNQSGIFNFSNNTEINNNINIEANTGDNNISGNGTSTITTGSTVSNSYINNQINQNFINTNNFSMLIRVQGNWTGDIFGLPEGMQWENTPNGIRLFYHPDDSNEQNINSVTSVTNNANITNNVQVYALTGNNNIENSNNSSIQTGKAYADSTIFNIANNNIVGSNWINLIFNIYGDWNGDLAFGQPDLWLGLSAQNGNRQVMRPGNEISYTYTIFNHGDVTAKNVILESEYPLSSLELSDTPTDIDTNDGKSVWSIGDIKAGETKEITIKAKVSKNFGLDNQVPLPLYTTVHSDQKDANNEDNSDSIVLYVKRDGSKYKSSDTFPAKLTIEKSADKDFAKAGDTVNYTIKLTNKGGPIFDALLVDTLKDDKGNVLSDQSWPLDTVKGGEKITITYSINLPANIKDGIYTNTAQLVGLQGSTKNKKQKPYETQIVEHELRVGNVPVSETLGLINTIPNCSPYLTTYLKQGRENDEMEVLKLQNFLKQNVTTDMIVTGVFDNDTRIAVEKFQQQYADDILAPWNMTESSGYVYYTTQKKINEMMCDNTTLFPLNSKQKEEIEYFRVNKEKLMNSDEFLFSVNTQNTPKTNSTALNTKESLMTSINQNSLFTSNESSVKKSKISYVRLSNWIYLFQNPRTAYLQ
jgi:hypothetical protein